MYRDVYSWLLISHLFSSCPGLSQSNVCVWIWRWQHQTYGVKLWAYLSSLMPSYFLNMCSRQCIARKWSGSSQPAGWLRYQCLNDLPFLIDSIAVAVKVHDACVNLASYQEPGYEASVNFTLLLNYIVGCGVAHISCCNLKSLLWVFVYLHVPSWLRVVQNDAFSRC